MKDSETRLPFLLAICLSVFIYGHLPQGNVQAVDKSSAVEKTTLTGIKALLSFNLQNAPKQLAQNKS